MPRKCLYQVWDKIMMALTQQSATEEFEFDKIAVSGFEDNHFTILSVYKTQSQRRTRQNY